MLSRLRKVMTLLIAGCAVASAPSLAHAYTRTIMGYAGHPVPLTDPAFSHDDASGVKVMDTAADHQILYPVALDQVGGVFSARVAVTTPHSWGGRVFCWAIAYQANGTATAVTSAATNVDGFQELNLPAVTVPANGYGSVSCWARAGRNPAPLTYLPPPTPSRIHRVMIQQ